MHRVVTHTEIRDIYFMAVITALPGNERDLGGCGSWPFLARICLLLSAVIPFQWQCVECKLLMSYRQTGCGRLENIMRDMIKIRGGREEEWAWTAASRGFCPWYVLVLQGYI